jgi:hypothetical protein
MILDCFLYYNEADIADIRVNVLKDVVDKFIVVQGNTTWRGNPNPYVFPEHLHEIADIEVYRVDFPRGKIMWEAERYVRNHAGAILRRRFGAKDRYIFSDADEIARPEVIADLDNGQYALEIDQYYYHFGNYIRHHDCMITGKIENILKFYEMRFEWMRSEPGSKQPNPRDQRRQGRRFPRIEGAGWEFSFFGDVEFIRNKIGQYSHDEINIPKYTDPAKIRFRMERDLDIVDRPKIGVPKGPLPKYVVENKQKFAQFWREDDKEDSQNLAREPDAELVH